MRAACPGGVKGRIEIRGIARWATDRPNTERSVALVNIWVYDNRKPHTFESPSTETKKIGRRPSRQLEMSCGSCIYITSTSHSIKLLLCFFVLKTFIPGQYKYKTGTAAHRRIECVANLRVLLDGSWHLTILYARLRHGRCYV
jgi:hypothetical protein